jgi:hypothetical protein
MQRKPTVLLLSAFVSTMMLAFACNLPAAAPPSTEPPTLAAVPTEASSSEATGQAIETGLPVVTLEGGSGYIFSSQLVSTDDRDIWWNAVQWVPATGDRMVSLGIISSPADVQEITFPGQTEMTLVPALGEGFGIEMSRGGQMTYAVIRVVQIDSDLAIAFDWVYPFEGNVTSGP